jgi:TPR repeat protein
MKMFWLVSLFCVVALLAWAQFHKSAPHDVPPDNSNTAVSTAGGAPATQAPVPKVDDTPRTDCDILAADPDDPGRKADGVPLEQVKPQRAFDACTAALKQYPDSPRLRLQLGRAIERGEHWDKAATEYRKAAQAGYAPARNTLVCLYTGGHFVEGSRTQGIEWLRQAAEQGFAPAQRTLGRLYKEGRLESDDDARAAEWLHKAALQGDAFAQYEFGDMCRTGRGVAQSYAQAAEWFRKAAERGNAEAQYKLGMMHITGVGMAQDYVQAAGFLRKAAEGGQNNAQDYAEFLRKPAVRGQDNARMWLGLMHEHGLGVKKDYAKAIEWYRKTIEQLAPNRRPRYIEDRIRVVELKTIQQALLHTKRIPDRAPRTDCDILAADPDDPNRKAAGVAFAASDLKQAMNACQSATAKYPNSPRLHYQLARIYAMDSNAEQAAAEYRKAAKGGYAPALNSLASWCDGIYQDHAPLFRQWLTTADQGNIDAKKGLGDRCKGNDDYAQAAFWYREMADKGNAYGQYPLGHLYEKGNGVDEDLLQAIGYYRKAADQGYADAMKALGGMYEKARGVTRDVHQAIVWYQKAADLESGGAMDALARIYMQGDGVERDDAQAFEWIRRRADLQLNWEGDESDSARITLGRMYKLGHGTPRDYAKAVECYQKIADKRRSAVGEADYIGRRALHNLGRM